MNPIIRQAVNQDFPMIFRLFTQLWPDQRLHPDNLQSIFQQCLDDENLFRFCAESNNQVVGFCSFYVQQSFWQEGTVAYLTVQVLFNITEF